MKKRQMPKPEEFSQVTVWETNTTRECAKFSPPNMTKDRRCVSDSVKMVKWAFSGRNGWKVTDETTDENGNWTVEFHRCNRNDRSRRTFQR